MPSTKIDCQSNQPSLLLFTTEEKSMSLAYYIVLNVVEPDFETFVNGKAIAFALEDLDTVCHQFRLPILDSFMGQGLSELQDFWEDEFEALNKVNDGQTWFDAQEGIMFVNSIMSAIKSNPLAVKNTEAVLDEFREYLHVLGQAKDINAKWHLAIDF